MSTQETRTMPYVNIRITREGTSPGATSTTPEHKAALIKGVSDLLYQVLGKPPDSTFIVIDEVELENWGWGGLPVPSYRKQHSCPSPWARVRRAQHDH
jgi:4-oxalocrotonate tautomerase